MIKMSMTYNGQPFSADRFVADVKREMMDAAEKELVEKARLEKARRAAAGKGNLDIKVERNAAGELTSISFSGDTAAVEAAESAVKGS